MSKKKLLLIPLLVFSSIVWAQSKSSVADMLIGRYVVRLIINPDNTYGYEINDGNKAIVHQKNKPYSSSQTGFTQKQNAMVTALWIANQLKEGKKNPDVSDPKKAKELGITKEDL